MKKKIDFTYVAACSYGVISCLAFVLIFLGYPVFHGIIAFVFASACVGGLINCKERKQNEILHQLSDAKQQATHHL